MRHSLRVLLFAGWSALSLSYLACESDEGIGGTSIGFEGGTFDVSSPPSTMPDAAEAPRDSGADAADAAPIHSCRDLHAESPALPSGTYDIDIDGDGPLPALSFYCDMTFDGGGWTLIQSYPAWTGSPNSLRTPPPDAGAIDGGPDAPWYVRPPVPKALGAWGNDVVKALAGRSSQVHIRTPFDVTTNVDGGAYITSAPPADGGVTRAMQNLRDLKAVSSAADAGPPGPDEWTGTFKSQAYGHNGCEADYPTMFWSCFGYGLHIVQNSLVAWQWQAPQFGNPSDPIEVYVR